MQVVLLERVEHLGQMGDIVSVRDGYARNYLIPVGKALRATKSNLTGFEHRRTLLEAQNLERREDAVALKVRVDRRTVIIIRQAGEGGHLYGSVNARDVSQALTADGLSVGRHQVRLEAALKTLGLHQVRIALHPEVDCWITVNVARSADEAELQADPRLAAEAASREADEIREAALDLDLGSEEPIEFGA